MSSKIFVILAIVLVMSSAVFAAIAPGYGYLPSSGGNDQPKPLEIELDKSCEGNTVTIYRRNTPDTVPGAHVTVTDVTGAPVFSGDTDGNGQITFEGCGMTVIIYASKSGWKPDEETHDLVPCEQCGEEEPVCGDGVCDEGETYENCPEDCPPPVVPPEDDGTAPGDGDGGPPEGEGMRCTTNDECEDNEYCDIPSSETVYGTCQPVTGVCGHAQDHAWVAHECGDEAGCPTCDTGYECVSNVCVESPPPTPPAGGAAAPPADETGEDGAGEGGSAQEDWFTLLLWLLLGLGILGGAAWWFLLRGSSRGRR